MVAVAFVVVVWLLVWSCGCVVVRSCGCAYELCEVKVSLFIVQLRCAFVHFRSFAFGEDVTPRRILLGGPDEFSSLSCSWFGSSNRSPDARESSWITGSFCVTSDGFRIILPDHVG